MTHSRNNNKPLGTKGGLCVAFLAAWAGLFNHAYASLGNKNQRRCEVSPNMADWSPMCTRVCLAAFRSFSPISRHSWERSKEQGDNEFQILFPEKVIKSNLGLYSVIRNMYFSTCKMNHVRRHLLFRFHMTS